MRTERSRHRVDTTMNADLSTSVEVESLLVNVGDYVTKGTPVLR